MKRSRPTERDHAVLSEFLAVLDGVHELGVRHAFVYDLTDDLSVIRRYYLEEA